MHSFGEVQTESHQLRPRNFSKFPQSKEPRDFSEIAADLPDEEEADPRSQIQVSLNIWSDDLIFV